MTKIGAAAALCVAFVAGALTARSLPPAHAAPMPATPTTPTQGWNLHIDAEKHFGDAHPTEIAHHWCKAVANGLTECQIYDSDAPNATLVGAETIVSPAIYKAMSDSEKALWHYHKDEIPKVNAKLPDLSPAEAQKVVEAIAGTYGKIYILYDPLATSGVPLGQPSVTVLK